MSPLAKNNDKKDLTPIKKTIPIKEISPLKSKSSVNSSYAINNNTFGGSKNNSFGELDKLNEI